MIALAKSFNQPRLFTQPHRLRSVSTEEGGAAPSWAPTDKSGLQVWFDFSDLANITKDGSNNIDQINDKSGNARHATQTSTNRPVWTANEQNSLGAGVFTSASLQYMNFGTTVLATSGSPNCILIIAKDVNPGSTWAHTLFTLNTVTTNKCYRIGFSNIANYTDVFWAWAPGVAQAGCRIPATITGYKAYLLNYNGGSETATGSYTCYTDNASQTVSASGNNGSTANFNRIGAPSVSSIASTHNGGIAEIMYWNSEATAGERTSIATYISNKWGISQAAMFGFDEPKKTRRQKVVATVKRFFARFKRKPKK